MAEPSSVVQYQTSIPEYARRYVEDLLGLGAGEIFDYEKDSQGNIIYRNDKGEIVSAGQGTPTPAGFKPYQQYLGERFAQFTPLQQYAFQQAGMLGSPQQMYDASTIARNAAMAAGQTRFDPLQYQAQSFTQPGTAQQYMSPYMQNVVDIQKREAQRGADIAKTRRGAEFARAGAFGGARQAIENAEAQRNLATQLGDIQARGSQEAYQQAIGQFNAEQAARQAAAQLGEQSRQYGAGLGLQGLQAAIAGAGQLGGIGQNIYGQQVGTIGLQNQLGQQQQQQVQNMLNADYQDFLNAQNMKFKQLGFMSDLLRGTQGLGQSNIYTYQQPPSFSGQVAGLGTALAGFGRMFAEGGSVTSDEAVESYLDDLSDQQLMQARQAAMAKQDMARLQLIEQELAQRASLRRGMGSAFNALPQQTQQRVVSAAEGGVMRFSNGGDPSGVGPEFSAAFEEPPAPPAPPRPSAAPAPRFEQADLRRLEAAQAKPEPKLTRSEKSAATKVATAVASQTQVNRSDLISDYQRLFAQFKNEDNEALKGIRDAIGKMNKLPEYDRNDAMIKFGLAMAQAASRPGANLLSSISAAAPELVAHKEKYEAEKRAMDRLNAQLQIEQAKYEMALRKDDRTAAMNIAGKMQDIQLQKDRLASEERRHRESMGRSQTGIMGIYEQLRKEAPSASAESLLTKAAEIQNTGVSMRTEAGRNVKLAEGLRKIDEQFKILPALKAGNPNDPMVAQMEAQRQQMIRDLYGSLGGGQPSGVTSPPAQPYTGFKMLGVQPSQ